MKWPHRPLLHTLQKVHTATLSGAARRFEHGLCHPRAAQEQRLIHLLSRNLGSAYGQAHRFASIRSIRDYQQRVPVVDYDALAPWIARIAAGEQRVLTRAPVRMLEPSGGSTAANKFIPYTDELLADFSRATNPWLHDLYSRVPGLTGTQSYWSISLAKRGERRTEGGVPIGFDDDTEYFSPIERWALTQMMAVPHAVAQAPDMDSWRWQTAHHLLRAEGLGLMSVWSPTFLTLIIVPLIYYMTEKKKYPETENNIQTEKTEEL
ncbi:MAG: GH3 auxin-responsive promoter family protein [Gammaproteobacteria bacterium]|nr:GH3 auxin-responsive promoter family protein [Gammaproteobacteria bacterium]